MTGHESELGPAAGHVPVLLDEVIETLSVSAGGTAVDLTAGRGGHALAIAERLGSAGRIVLVDLDAGNLAAAAERVGVSGAEVVTFRGNFADLPAFLSETGIAADAVLADLGFASTQVDDPERGLSFKRDGPLDMRLDPSGPTTAADLIASLDERELADMIYQFGEERHSRRVARKLVEARAESPITTTAELARIVRSAIPHPGGRGHGRSSRGRGKRSGGIDPATRTFQALRIAVNDELGSLDRLLASVREAAVGTSRWIAAGGRIGIISFHSLEDRPVKQAFRAMADNGLAERITRKPIVAGDAEAASNPRARSAKLRVIRIAESSAQTA
ncbi:MAG: 16S rRNA (cytosine(1402)-N(4))-methyltransferase [Phycisphaerae bacterium]|nr:16S rRNA (cytosine(1402)-N(4))-methyltransferase [Phycisphaerae bacterium]